MERNTALQQQEPLDDIALLIRNLTPALEHYLPNVLVAVGMVGNVLSFLLLSGPQYRTSSTCVYMKAVAISDSIHLLSIPLQRSVAYILLDKIKRMSPNRTRIFCTQGMFWLYFSPTVSSYLLFAMSLDRLLALVFPFKSRVSSSVSNAMAVVVAIFVVAVVLHLPIQFIRYDSGQARFPNSTLCPAHFDDGFSNVYEQLFSVFVIYFPFVAIFTCNAGIIVVVEVNNRNTKILKPGTDQHSDRKDGHITVMLLIVSFTFVVCLLPSRIRNAYWADYSGKLDIRTIAIRRLTIAVTLLVQYCNYALNFYMYTLPIKKFRQDLKRMLLCSVTKFKTVSHIRQSTPKA
jgi:hypothetical protein